jgi:hypothetical protein
MLDQQLLVYLLILITEREDMISKFDILFYFVKTIQKANFTWVLKEFYNCLLYL